MAKKYYDLSALLATQAQYMMLLGKRSNGKSYAVKKQVLKDAYEKKERFIYLRRWRDDTKNTLVTKYFADAPVSVITKGKYERVVSIGQIIYFESGKGKNLIREEIGTACSLNERERYKSVAFQTEDIYYKYIIYEEFITDRSYLDLNEPDYLQQFVSTVARDRLMTVFLIGNTISRVCPYFTAWGLVNTIEQKQGTIEEYHFSGTDENGEPYEVKIAVENCENNTVENKMFFGEISKQIIKGDWETRSQPKLPQPYEHYEMVYEVLLEYMQFKFTMQLLVEPDEGGLIVYVYPKSKRRYSRIISDKFSDKPYITNTLNHNNKAELRISECIRRNKVCFSENLTGTEFKRICSEFIFT